MRRVAVTGRGVVSPLGIGIDSHWQALVAGRSAIAPIPRLAALGLPATRGAEITAELMAPYASRLPRKQQKLYNRATSLAILAASLAMEDAGLRPGGGAPERFGVLLGVNALWWDLEAMTAYVTAAESKEQPGALDMAAANAFCMHNINPLDYSLKTLPNLIAGHVAIAHDAQGLCRAMVDGPVGGAHAIGQAHRMIAEGELDVALCGGADAQLESLNFAFSWGAGLIASDTGDWDGSIYGEASGVLVLEDAERASARSASIHAEVVGYAAAGGDGLRAHETEPAALAARLIAVVETALTESGREPDVVSLWADGAESHDQAERIAMERVFGRGGDRPVCLAPKRLHADLGAAAAAVELLTCSSVLETALIPPGISLAPDSPSRPLRRALVVTLGPFGDCAAIMLERA